MSSNDLLYHLYHGRFDDMIDEIVAAAQKRLRAVTEVMVGNLRRGDDVIFNATVNPKYLVGASAEVLAVKRGKIRVRLDDACGDDFPAGSEVEVPASTLQIP